MSIENYIYNNFIGDYYIIKFSGLFDFNWYSEEYHIDKSEDLVKHFLYIGCKNNYNPTPNFDMIWYLNENTDVKNSNINPFVHYIKYGKQEGRLPLPYHYDLKYKSDYATIINSGLFDKDWFCKQYNLDKTVDPIYYYLLNYLKLGLNPSPNFDTTWYLNENTDVKNSNMNPFVHYIKYGKQEGRLPIPYHYDLKYKSDYATIINSGLFDKDWFCKQYNLDKTVDPIYYYLLNYLKLGLNPSPDFDTTWYLNENTDVKNSNMNPFVHYIKYGKQEGKLPRLYEFNEIPKLCLNKTIIGKNNYLFLINDTNNELRQHFDKNYENKFKYKEFTRDYFIKKYLFEKMDITYHFFVIPDKSIICKDLIPIKKNTLKRNTNKIKFIPDFSEHLDYTCCWNNDSHLSYKGAEKLAFDFLNYINNTFSDKDFENLINNCNFIKCQDPSDLLWPINWSYTENDKKNFKISSLEYPIPKKLIKLDIPEEFKVSYHTRASEYYYNPDSFSNLKVLIFRDSSTTNLKYFLTLYFREVFLYWDYMLLNENIIKWYNPDIVLEIRIERFLENYATPNCIKKRFNVE